MPLASAEDVRFAQTRERETASGCCRNARMHHEPRIIVSQSAHPFLRLRHSRGHNSSRAVKGKCEQEMYGGQLSSARPGNGPRAHLTNTRGKGGRALKTCGLRKREREKRRVAAVAMRACTTSRE